VNSGVSAAARPNATLSNTHVADGARVNAGAATFIELVRPRQWTKNLLLCAAIIFAVKITDISRLISTVEAVAAYCAASSAAYVFNDLIDIDRDRMHPSKRNRVLARGALSRRNATIFAISLAAAAVAVASQIGTSSVTLLLTFLALQVGYSLVLKHAVLLDVLSIAALFVLRSAAGGVAAAVRVSPWLLLCSGLLALFLALSKRRAELLRANPTSARPSLQHYTPELLTQFVLIAATSTIASYALYTFTARDSKALMITIPFVVYGIFRYLLLVDGDQIGEEPETVFLSDRPMLVCIGIWVATAGAVLALT
jgi:4-hydroxybenzoate polyprenyltransferase